jgi:hypothetical protein
VLARLEPAERLGLVDLPQQPGPRDMQSLFAASDEAAETGAFDEAKDEVALRFGRRRVMAGVLEVGLTCDGKVVINHPDLDADENGVGHIVFSAVQARALAALLLKKAEDAEADSARLLCVDALSPVVSGPVLGYPTAPPPRHPFEVTVRIGGNDWRYVTRTMNDLATHIEERGADCSMCSGGGGGCHNVHIAKRDVTPEQYEDELLRWAGHK